MHRLIAPLIILPVILGTPAQGQMAPPPSDNVFQAVPGCPRAPSKDDHGYQVCADQMAILAGSLAAARASGKLLLIEIAASWCPQCHALQRMLPGDSILAHRDDGFDYAGRFHHVAIVTSTLVDGRPVDVPSGIAARDLLAARATGAAMRGWPYLYVVDPAPDGRSLGYNTDGLATADGAPDPAKMRTLLRATWAALREGADAPGDAGPSLFERMWHKLLGA